MVSTNINVLAPETLPNRPMLKTQAYASAGESYSLDTVGVSFTAIKGKKHTYIAPSGDSDVAETLRRYVLVRSRYDLPETSKYATRWGVSREAFEVANRVVANIRYIHAFGDDPSVGTTDTQILADVLSEGNPPKPAILAALRYVGTQAFDDLLAKMTDLLQVMELRDIRGEVIRYIYRYWTLDRLADHNSKHSSERRRSLKEWRSLVQWIDNLGDTQKAANAVRKEKGQAQSEKEGRPVKAYPDRSELVGRWEQLVVSKPELAINHTGKLGRRIIAADSGREPRYINRIVTDPDRRIFSRKTRALGGVVLIDASGSMSLSEDDLDRLLKASAGATVVMYSGGHDSPNIPNTWVIARKGRMCRRLPEVPGNNCVDGPALIYAASLRERASQPLIWVSDGHVTGKSGNHSNENLLTDIEYIRRRYRVTQVSNVNEAERLMKRLQGGK